MIAPAMAQKHPACPWTSLNLELNIIRTGKKTLCNACGVRRVRKQQRVSPKGNSSAARPSKADGAPESNVSGEEREKRKDYGKRFEWRKLRWRFFQEYGSILPIAVKRSPSCIVSCKKEAFAPPSHSPSLTSKSCVRL